MSLGYVWQKYYEAVQCLAASPEPLQKRVGGALNVLGQLGIQGDEVWNDIPEQVQGQHVAIIQHQDRVRDGVIDMDDDQATRLADKIFNAFHDVVKLYAVDEHKSGYPPLP